MSKSLVVIFISLILLNSCHSKKKQTEAADKPIEKEENVEAFEPVTINYEVPLEIDLLHKNLSDSVYARIERTPCFGRCPIYTITIYENGYTVYEGENFTDLIGKYETNIKEEKLKQLMDEAERIKFFELDPIYDNENVTDLPATLLTIKKDGSFKTTINRYEGPQELDEFQTFFDSLLRGANWITIENEQKE